MVETILIKLLNKVSQVLWSSLTSKPSSNQAVTHQLVKRLSYGLFNSFVVANTTVFATNKSTENKNIFPPKVIYSCLNFCLNNLFVSKN